MLDLSNFYIFPQEYLIDVTVKEDCNQPGEDKNPHINMIYMINYFKDIAGIFDECFIKSRKASSTLWLDNKLVVYIIFDEK